MKAMILAAGRGERMRPLTAHTPKPLLKVAGKPLLEYHLARLVAAGVSDIVINIAYLGEQIREYFGSRYEDVSSGQSALIEYSVEPEPLETAGAILNALPLLGDAPFLLVNGDVWTDYPFSVLLEKPLVGHQGHLVLVENPEHHPEGDFFIDAGLLAEKSGAAKTFSGISLLSPELIKAYPKARRVFPLGEVFRDALKNQQLSAEVYSGQWWDIGTVERLQQLEQTLKGSG